MKNNFILSIPNFAGNCSPKFMRSTVYNVPTNQDVLKASGVPFAVSVSPFAEIPGEEVQ